MNSSSGAFDALVKRILLLRRRARATEEACQEKQLQQRARAVIETLDDAETALRCSTSATPEILTHVARLLDHARERLHVIAQLML